LSRTSSSLRLLYAAFFLSGASGLIYEVLWMRMLTRVFGATTPATSTVLCVFMGGLALGAYLGGVLSDRLRRPLRAYAMIEIAIALSAILASFAVIQVLGGVYVELHRLFGTDATYRMLTRAGLSAVCLIAPAALMGATLPLLMTFITHARQSFQPSLGRLYAVNTFGAVTGVLAAGYLLIGAVGETATLLTAVLLNLLAAGFVLRLDRRFRLYPGVEESGGKPEQQILPRPYPPAIRTWCRIALFASGFAALAGEVLWTRLLMLPLKTSIYAFSAMLALFLVGIASGSWLSARTAASARRPVVAFALLEMIIGLLILAGLVAYTQFGHASDGFSSGFLFYCLSAPVMILPVAVAFGWQFPVAVRCSVSDAMHPGRETGWAYAANTLGSIFGSLSAGFLLIPLLGVVNTLIGLAALNFSLGAVLMAISPREERGRLPKVGAALAAGFLIVAAFVSDPYRSLMEEKAKILLGPDAQVYEVFEGISGTTVPAGRPSNPLSRHLYIDGVGMTVLISETKMMAHLPMALVPEPKDVLVVCFGMGTTVRSATRFPIVPERIDAVDIVPHVFDCFPYFHPDAAAVAAHPSVRFYAEDGRNFLLVRDRRYDVITIDPAPPIFSAGTVNLYSREFLELCKSRIHKDGVVCLWLPPSPPGELEMIMKTFVNVFPGASLWGGLSAPGFFLTGGHRSFAFRPDQVMDLARRLAAIPDVSEWNERFKDPAYLREMYLMGPDLLKKTLAGVRQITDDRPYTEFPLWRGTLVRRGPLLTADKIRNLINRLNRQ
jgi:spermidine synthase